MIDQNIVLTIGGVAFAAIVGVVGFTILTRTVPTIRSPKLRAVVVVWGGLLIGALIVGAYFVGGPLFQGLIGFLKEVRES